MLKLYRTRIGARKSIIAVALIAMSGGCGAEKMGEEKFSLYINNRSYNELIYVLKYYSKRHGYHLTEEIQKGDRPETTSKHIMIEGDGTRTLIQSALAEQCKEREGRRDVEYSPRVFDINMFETSYLIHNEKLYKQSKQMKEILNNSGFLVVSREESCNLL